MAEASRSGRTVHTALLTLALALGGGSSPARSEEGSGPIGLWVGPIEHAGQHSRFGMRISADAEGRLQASVSMPAIGAFDVAVGTAVVEGARVRIGGWTVDYDSGTDTLSGTVPAALLPVYQVSFTLRRSDSLERPAAPEPAPLAAPRWMADLGAPVWAGVATGNGLVFGATDGGSVVALRESDGSPVWRHAAGAAIRATPTLAGEALYVHADDGSVARLEAASGALVWRRGVGPAVERIAPGQPGSQYANYASSVIVAGGSAFVGTDSGALVALDPATGEERWRREEDSSLLGTPTSDGRRVFYGAFDGSLVARDAATGDELWRTRTGGAIVGSPTRAGSVLVIGNRAYDVLGVRSSDGKVAWKHYYWFSWVESTATVAQGVAYIGSSDGQRLQALDAASGAPLWHFPTEGSTWATPAVSGDRVYVGSVGVADYIVDHQARFHAVRRDDGSPAWRFEVEAPEGAGTWGFASSPALGDLGVYVGGLDGRVYAFAH